MKANKHTAKALFAVSSLKRFVSRYRSSGDVRGRRGPSHRPAFFALPFTTALLALAFALLALAAAVLAAAAQAAAALAKTIGGPEAGERGGLFTAPRGVAVNQFGNGGVPAGTFYIVDSANNRIQRFSSVGTFFGVWGRDIVSGAFA